MKRRVFTQVAAGAAFSSVALLHTNAVAQAAKPKPGTDYQVLDSRAPVEAPAGKIEVVEFFWFNCPHCNAFEPELGAWLKTLPKDVAFRRVPVAFNDSFVPQQKLFYALDAMGLVDKYQLKVFDAIHKEKQNLSKADGILDWISKQGIDKTKFADAFNSFSVATKANKAKQLQDQYQVAGVPTLGVAGRFMTDGEMTRNMTRALAVVDYLVAEVRARR